MESDFMGLNAKDYVVVLKEEAIEECKDSGKFYFNLGFKILINLQFGPFGPMHHEFY